MNTIINKKSFVILLFCIFLNNAYANTFMGDDIASPNETYVICKLSYKATNLPINYRIESSLKIIPNDIHAYTIPYQIFESKTSYQNNGKIEDNIVVNTYADNSDRLATDMPHSVLVSIKIINELGSVIENYNDINVKLTIESADDNSCYISENIGGITEQNAWSKRNALNIEYNSQLINSKIFLFYFANSQRLATPAGKISSTFGLGATNLISLGYLKNGSSAGYMNIYCRKHYTVACDTNNPACLRTFSHLEFSIRDVFAISLSPEIIIEKDITNHIRKIFTNQYLIKIENILNGITISFYPKINNMSNGVPSSYGTVLEFSYEFKLTGLGDYVNVTRTEGDIVYSSLIDVNMTSTITTNPTLEPNEFYINNWGSARYIVFSGNTTYTRNNNINQSKALVKFSTDNQIFEYDEEYEDNFGKFSEDFLFSWGEFNRKSEIMSYLEFDTFTYDYSFVTKSTYSGRLDNEFTKEYFSELVFDYSGHLLLPTIYTKYISDYTHEYALLNKINFDYSDYNNPGIYNSNPVFVTTTIFFSSNISNIIQKKNINYTPLASDHYLRDMPFFDLQANGTAKTFAYQKGVYDYTNNSFTVNTAGSELRIVSIEGIEGSEISAWDGLEIHPINLVDNQSIINVVVKDHRGFTIREEIRIYDGFAETTEECPLISWTNMTYLSSGELIYKESDKGVEYEAGYLDGQKLWQIIGDGIKTEYEYDVNGNVKKEEVYPIGTTNDITIQSTKTIEYEYLNKRVTHRDVKDSFGTSLSEEFDYYNNSGAEKLKNIQGYITSYDLKHNSKQITFADGTIKNTVNYADGRLKYITGDTVIPEFYEYGYEPGAYYGLYNTWVKKTFGYNPNPAIFGNHNLPDPTKPEQHTNRWIKSTYDSLGNVIKIEKPTETGQIFTETYHYNTKNQLEWSQQTGLPKSYYFYDEFGQLSMTVVDVDNDGIDMLNDEINFSDADRFSGTHSSYVQNNNVWYIWTGNWTLPKENSSQIVYTDQTWVQLTGLPEGVVSYTTTIDQGGNSSYKYILIDRSTALRTIVEGNSASTNESTFYVHAGYLRKQISSTGVTVEYKYDGLGRLIEIIDSRVGASTFNYHSHTVDDIVYETDKISEVHSKSPNGTVRLEASYSYDTLGRLTEITNAEGKATYYAYNTRGQIHRVWGDVPYPVEYAYDGFGAKARMSTFRAGANWATATWPAGDHGARVAGYNGDDTLFAYEPTTGLLKSRTDALGRNVEYTYNVRGQLKTRKWQRNALQGTTRLTTTYRYYDADEGTTRRTGEIYKIDYPEESSIHATDSFGSALSVVPLNTDITYTYNRRGALKSISDASGSRTYGYRETGSNPDLMMSSELLAPDFYGTQRALHYSYDTHDRLISLSFLQDFIGGSPTTLVNTQYAYQPDTGRLQSITGTYAHTYAYLADSDLVESVQTTVPAGLYSQTRSWSSHRNALTALESKLDSASIARYAYRHDNLWRRSDLTQTGSLFGRYGAGLVIGYSYNDRNELTGYNTWVSDDPDTLPSAPLPGRGMEYGYDPIGNRKRATTNDATGAWYTPSGSANYNTNALNQYTSRTNPGELIVSGFVDKSATTTVNGASVSTVWWWNPASDFQDSEYFYKYLAKQSGAASSGGIQSITVSAQKNVSGTVHRGEETLQKRVRPNSESFSYDQDGNLTGDGAFTYVYDAENRVAQVHKRFGWSASLYDGGTYSPQLAGEWINYRYDYMGRIVERAQYQRYDIDGNTFDVRNWAKRYIYEGWNMVAELDVVEGGGLPAVKRTYVWGTDLSGSIGGAGGIGGLLEVKEHVPAGMNAHMAMAHGGDPGVYIALADGNGNVAGLVSAESGGLVAEYEYDPFGEELRASGRRIAQELPLRYQAKFFDKDTELSHFGLRHYTATLGRFINRDPVEEPGRWRQFVGLRYGNHNPFYGARKLGGSWLAEFQTRQDTLTQNTSLPHTTEAVGVGIYKKINLPVGEVGTKKYSANANNTGHIGQGGKQTPDWYPLVTPPGSPSPYNRDTNLYSYAGNDPVNGYDAYGLWLDTFLDAVDLTISVARTAYHAGATAYHSYQGSRAEGRGDYGAAAESYSKAAAQADKGVSAATDTLIATTAAVIPGVPAAAAKGVVNGAETVSKLTSKADDVADAGVDITLKYKPDWTDAQKVAAQQKATTLTNADTVVTKNIDRNGTAQSRYRKDNSLDSNTDADHTIDLQLGGKDVTPNISSLDKSVNRSLGSQIQHQIKDLPDGTKINKVNIQ